LSSRLFFRVDVTSEKRFTLSEKTKEILKNTKDVIFVKVYLDGELPVGFKKLRGAIQETLDEFRIYAGDNLQYQFINPTESASKSVREKLFNELVDKGLKPINIKVNEKEGEKSEKVIFPGAVVSYNGIEIPVDLLANNVEFTAEENLNNSIQNIEYELIKTIFILSNKNVEKIAFLEGQGELNEIQTGDVTRELSNYFQVDRGKINGTPGILDSYKAIVIARPTVPFSEPDKLVLDQYIMNGGKVLWLVDGVSVNRDSLANGSSLGLVNSLNIDDLLFTYGARINPNLVQDIQCNVLPVQTGSSGNQNKWTPAPWLYYPLISPLVQHPITRGLNLIFSRFVSTIDTVGNQLDVKKTVLLRSSGYTKLVNAPLFISLAEVKANPVKEQFNKPNQPLAVLLEGKFKSVYRNRNLKDIIQGWNKEDLKFSKPGKMIVIADGDMIENDVKLTANGPMITALGYDKYTGQTFANKEFIVNAVSYLTDENGLLSLRSKDFKLRLLDKKEIEEHSLFWKLINTVLPVAIVLLFGILFFQIRRIKYSKKF